MIKSNKFGMILLFIVVSLKWLIEHTHEIEVIIIKLLALMLLIKHALIIAM